MEPVDRVPGSPAETRPVGQAGEQPVAELPLKPADPPDEVPTTAAELVAALLPLGDSPGGGDDSGSPGVRWLVSLQRFSPSAVWLRIRSKSM